MTEDTDSTDWPGENLANAHKAASEAYSRLVHATADICTPRYHYYCDDVEARLPDELVVVANTRRVPIRDNEVFRIGSGEGALEAEPVPGKGPAALRFVPIRGSDGKKALVQWKAAVRDDLDQIQKTCPEANYICMSEFGFPFGLSHHTSIDVPDSDSDWKWLQSSAVLTSRFVCLGSAHRSYYRSRFVPTRASMQYENVAVVYPSGTDPSTEPKEIFLTKRDRLTGVALVDGVSLVPQVGRGITARFEGTEIVATRRADLSAPACAAIEPARLKFAKEAFDFFDMTAESREPPVYLRKKSPARKLGEYIDANGKYELDVFVTNLGVTAVLICYDAFDPSIFLSAVRMYYDSLEQEGGFIHQAVDIFFVPAFNRSQKFVEMCKVLSLETNSIVVYVSGDDRCRVKSDVFVCGQSCETWAKGMAKDQGHDIFYSLTKIPASEHLHVHRIRKDVINAAMRHTRLHANPKTRKSLIGPPKRLGPEALG
jgi:hypothetical protein